MKFGPVDVAAAAGSILAHGCTAGGLRLPKGHTLSGDDIAALRTAGVSQVIAARLEAGDAGEDEAAARIAAALSSPAIRPDTATTGRVNLFAETAGVLRVNAALANRLNAIDPAITLATLPDHAAVAASAMVATIKIIPFAVRAEAMERALALPLARLLGLHAFRQMRAALLQTELPSLKPSVVSKTVDVTRRRMEAMGGTLDDLGMVEHRSDALAERLRDVTGFDAVIVFGASAMADFEDVIPEAIRLAGGRVIRAGMPVDPGNLLTLGRIAGRPVVGAPGCARSPKENGFDWVLARLCAGLRITSRDIARMGVGGLLMEIPSRPRPRLGTVAADD